MKKILFIWLLSVFTLHSVAQTKVIRGFVYDDYTNYRLDSVRISPVLFENVAYADGKGKFKIILPSKYRDTIVFSHPDYYPFIKRILPGDAMKIQMIKLIPRTFKLDTICYLAFKENVLVESRIVDDMLNNPIYNAQIRLENNDIIAYSDIEGNFKAVIPKSNENFIINHPDFNTVIVPVKKINMGKRSRAIKLSRKVPMEKDTVWVHRNNFIAFSVAELFNGGTGIRYERFIGLHHSAGLHLTGYILGFSWPMIVGSMTNDRFNGIKIAPFYHYYIWRNAATAGYAEIKPLFSYFDFYSLDYAMQNEPEYEYNVSKNFWSAGLGASFGWLFFPGKNKFTLGLSAGFQYMPWNVPKKIKNDEGVTYEIDKTWWYLGGPGSYFEIKCIIGGFF